MSEQDWVNRIAVGTAQFGLTYGVANSAGQVGTREVASILDHAREVGIDSLDTAILYGNSESVLGQVGLQRMRLVSKLPDCPLTDNRKIAAWVDEQVSGSLRRLKIEKLDAVLFHRPDQLTGIHGRSLFRALLRLKESKLIGKIGISVYRPEDVDMLDDSMDFDLVQVPFNIIDRRLEESGYLDEISRRGIEIHARSVFLQGLLLMDKNRRPKFFDRWCQLWDVWEHWLGENRLSPLEACLRYVLSFGEIDRFVIGIDSLSQFQQITSVAYRPLPPVPPELQCSDLDLVNPMNWAGL